MTMHQVNRMLRIQRTLLNAEYGHALCRILYNTLFSREEIFAKSEFGIFSREDIFANIQITRKYLPAKISSRENNFPRKYHLAKISSRENIFLEFVPCRKYRLVGLAGPYPGGGVREVRPNPPFREPPPKHTNPPHLKLSTSRPISDISISRRIVASSNSSPNHLQHSILPSNQVKSLELSQKIVKRIVAGAILLQLTTLLSDECVMVLHPNHCVLIMWITFMQTRHEKKCKTLSVPLSRNSIRPYII